MYKVMFTMLFLALVIVAGCSEQQVAPADDKGDISLVLNKSVAPENISAITVELFKDGFEPVIKNISYNNFTGEYSIKELETGKWQVRVRAVDKNDAVLYTGETSIDVLASVVTPLGLELENKGSGSLGKISFNVLSGDNSWVDYSGNPIFTAANSPFNPIGITIAKILPENGKYRIWYSNLYNSAVSNVGYAESNNAINWTATSDTAVLSQGPVGSWDSHAVQAGAVVKENGIYRMYYTGYSIEFEHWHIGLATSQDGIHWVKQPNPVLYGNDDEYQVHVDEVLKFNNKWYMYYTIRNPYKPVYYTIGMAISDDGLCWTRYSGNPILTGSACWENNGVYSPSVIMEDNKLKMAYMNATAGAFGFATSQDGIHWTKDQNNPFFTLGQVNNNWASSIAYPFLREFNNKYYLYYTGTYQGNNAIGLAIKESQQKLVGRFHKTELERN